jgi:hypothetical protein
MKKIIFILMFMFSVTCLFAEEVPKVKSETNMWFVKMSDTVYFQPTIGIASFWIDFTSREYEIGFAPGIGYGIKWKPNWWRDNASPTISEAKKLPFLGLDLFVQAKTVKRFKTYVPYNYKIESNYFAIEPIVTVSFLDWLYVGYGPRVLISLNKGKTTKFSHVMTLGLATSF